MPADPPTVLLYRLPAAFGSRKSNKSMLLRKGIEVRAKKTKATAGPFTITLSRGTSLL